MMVWDFNPGRVSVDRTGKMISPMQPMRGMDWEVMCLCSQLEFKV